VIRSKKKREPLTWQDNNERRALLLAIAYDAMKLTGRPQAGGFPFGGFPRLCPEMEFVFRWEAQRLNEEIDLTPRGGFACAHITTVMEAIELAKVSLSSDQLAMVAASAIGSLGEQASA
jgi:hypothetical protein